MNLLFEWISRYEKRQDPGLSQKIEELAQKMNSTELSSEDDEVLKGVLKRFEKARKSDGREPLLELRQRNLERAFLRFQGLVFDLKTRFDYMSPEVAIQDGLDLSEYVKEVIEEIHQDLKESHSWDNPDLQEFQQGLSQLYSSFSRERLKELYPQFAHLLKLLRDAVKTEN